MKPVWFASALALLVGGCLSGGGPATDYIAPAREQAAAAVASGKTTRTVWQAPGGARSSDFIYETGDGILVAGLMDFGSGGQFPMFGGMQAHDAATGELLWRASRPKISRQWSTDIIVEHPLLVFMHVGERVVFDARDRRTGKQAWSFDLKPGLRAISAPWAGILTTVGKGRATAYSLETGKKQWSRKLDRSDTPPEPVEKAGGLYVLLSGGVIRLDPANGETLWELKQPKSGAVLSIQSDGRLIVAYGDSGYSVLDMATGSVLASERTPKRVGFVILAEERILIGTGDDRRHELDRPTNWAGGRLIALDRRTGGVAWRFDLPNPLATTLLIDKDRLVFATQYRFMALDVRSGNTRFTQILPLPLLKVFHDLDRLVRVGEYFIMVRNERETIVARATDGKLLRIHRTSGIRDIGGFGGPAIGDLAVIDNPATIGAAAPAAGRQGASTTAQLTADNSFSTSMEAKSARVRSDPNSSSAQRLTAIGGSSVGIQMDASWGRTAANVNMLSAAMAYRAALRAEAFANMKATQAFKNKSEQGLYMRAVDDGYLVKWVERDGLYGLEFTDFVKSRNAFIAVSPKLDRDLDGGQGAFEFSGDGRKLYTFGIGFDPSFMEPAVNGRTTFAENELLPAGSFVALDFDKIRFAPIAESDWEKIPANGPSDVDPAKIPCASFESWQILYYVAMDGDMRARRKCPDIRYTVEDMAIVPRRFTKGSTNLMAAAFRGDDVAVDSLIGSGFNPALRNAAGLNAADYARLGGDTKLAKKLDRLAGS